MRAFLIPAVLLLAAVPGGARDRSIPVATPDGPAVSCIPLSQVKNTRVRSDNIIDFEMRGGKVYRNTLPQSCPSLGFEERFIHKTSTNNYCSSDIITVFDSGSNIPGPSCGLGEFQPVKLSKPAR